MSADYTAWPFLEAQKLLEKYKQGCPSKGYILFMTGYGPSGLPHIGTLAEVIRTNMVRRAFKELQKNNLAELERKEKKRQLETHGFWPRQMEKPSHYLIETKLYCFSDDLDGLRSIPETVPDPEVLRPHLGKPLSAIPDPFGTHESFAAHNNAKLREFLDRFNKFNCEYEFQSATEWYRNGKFDDALRKTLESYEKIQEIILPTLGPERARTYSPFLPISPASGRVLQVPIVEHRPDQGTVVFQDEDGITKEVPVTGGHCKLQWKPDWAMRWYVMDVDYEMYGKDLMSSHALSAEICRVLGRSPPQGFHYELFLDEEGRKISKSHGKGFSVEKWLEYAPPECLVFFIHQKPQSAKKFHAEDIHRMVETCVKEARKEIAEGRTFREDITNFIKNNSRSLHYRIFNYSLLLGITKAVEMDSPDTLWKFVKKNTPTVSPQDNPDLDQLIKYVFSYYQDHKSPKVYRDPLEKEKAPLRELKTFLENFENCSQTTNPENPHNSDQTLPQLREAIKKIYNIIPSKDQLISNLQHFYFSRYINNILRLELALDLALPESDKKNAPSISKLREARERNFPEIQNKIEELWNEADKIEWSDTDKNEFIQGYKQLLENIRNKDQRKVIDATSKLEEKLKKLENNELTQGFLSLYTKVEKEIERQPGVNFSHAHTTLPFKILDFDPQLPVFFVDEVDASYQEDRWKELADIEPTLPEAFFGQVSDKKIQEIEKIIKKITKTEQKLIDLQDQHSLNKNFAFQTYRKISKIQDRLKLALYMLRPSVLLQEIQSQKYRKGKFQSYYADCLERKRFPLGDQVIAKLEGIENFLQPKEDIDQDLKQEILTSIRTILDENRAYKIQSKVHEIGKRYFSSSKEWFECLYEVLFGQKSGPMMGSLITVYGIPEIIDLIDEKLKPPTIEKVTTTQ